MKRLVYHCHEKKNCSDTVQNKPNSHILDRGGASRQSSKDALNKIVFRSCLNARYDDDVLIDAGNAFQALAAATGNALSPGVIRRVNGTRSVNVEPERRRRRKSTSDFR